MVVAAERAAAASEAAAAVNTVPAGVLTDPRMAGLCIGGSSRTDRYGVP